MTDSYNIDQILMFCEPWNNVNIPCPNHDPQLTKLNTWWYCWNWVQKIETFGDLIEIYGFDTIFPLPAYGRFLMEVCDLNTLILGGIQDPYTQRILSETKALIFALKMVQERDFKNPHQTKFMARNITLRLQQVAEIMCHYQHIHFVESTNLN